MGAEQIEKNAQAIQTYGAGVIALVIIFGIVIFAIFKFVPILNKIGESLVESIDSIKIVIAAFTKTVETMQNSNLAANALLVAEIRQMKYDLLSSNNILVTKLEHHCDLGERIEDKTDKLIIISTEVKGNTRNCAGDRRGPTTRTRKTDKEKNL